LEFKGRRLPNTFGGGGQSILKKKENCVIHWVIWDGYVSRDECVADG